MFLGAYEHTLDEKGRLTLPARFRESFQDGLVVTHGLDGCLAVYPAAHWRVLVDSQLAVLNPLSRDDRMIQRHFSTRAAESVPDRQGRIGIPAALASGVGLEREVMVLGVFDHLEIWDRARWLAESDGAEGRVADAAERLAAKRD